MAMVRIGPEGRLIAAARHDHDPTAKGAEIVLVVRDRWQGKGLGTILLTERLEARHPASGTIS
ncbi:MAG: GNAT family N-acetyltransferase [Candidatus Methylomirabilia bacterium]